MGSGAGQETDTWRARGDHLTYKSHLSGQVAKQILPTCTANPSASPLYMRSRTRLPTIPTRTSTIKWRKHFDTHDCRVFDIEDEDGHTIHPNIGKVQSLQHAKVIVTKYHWGIKDGGDKKVPPVGPIADPQPAPYQINCDAWMMEAESWLLGHRFQRSIPAREFPNLAEAN